MHLVHELLRWHCWESTLSILSCCTAVKENRWGEGERGMVAEIKKWWKVTCLQSLTPDSAASKLETEKFMRLRIRANCSYLSVFRYCLIFVALFVQFMQCPNFDMVSCSTSEANIFRFVFVWLYLSLMNVHETFVRMLCIRVGTFCPLNIIGVPLNFIRQKTRKRPHGYSQHICSHILEYKIPKITWSCCLSKLEVDCSLT